VVTIVPFTFRRSSGSSSHPENEYGGVAVEFSSHVNTRFLAVQLQTFARAEDCKAVAVDEGDGSYTVRVWDGPVYSAEDVVSKFGELVHEAVQEHKANGPH
jgi:hypothetical protein